MQSYIYNNKRHYLNEGQYEQLLSAVSLYNALVEGEDIPEFDTSWHTYTGYYYGIIAECRYQRCRESYKRFSHESMFHVILSDDLVLKCKTSIEGTISLWRQAYYDYFGTYDCGDASEMVGMFVELSIHTNYPIEGGKPYSTVQAIRFISDAEYEYILQQYSEVEANE